MSKFFTIVLAISSLVSCSSYESEMPARTKAVSKASAEVQKAPSGDLNVPVISLPGQSNGTSSAISAPCVIPKSETTLVY